MIQTAQKQADSKQARIFQFHLGMIQTIDTIGFVDSISSFQFHLGMIQT